MKKVLILKIDNLFLETLPFIFCIPGDTEIQNINNCFLYFKYSTLTGMVMDIS